MSFRRSSLFIWQLFGWEPQSLFDEVFNIVENMALKAHNILRQFALEKNDLTFKSRLNNEFDHGTIALKQAFAEAVDLVVDKFEVYCYRNVFSIPENLISGGWLRTPDQEGVDFTDIGAARRVQTRLQNVQTQIDWKREHLAKRQMALKELEAQQANLETILRSIPNFNQTEQERLQNLLASVKELQMDAPVAHKTDRDVFNDLVVNTCTFVAND